MKLRSDLAATPYTLPRGNGFDSIPFTGGNRNNPDYARYASAAFFTKAELLAGASIAHAKGKMFLGRVDNKMIGIADNRHIVTLAGSGGGKSVCSLIPNLMLYDGSALVLDPKGELATETAAHRAQKLGQKVVVLDPWGAANVSDDLRGSFNPLEELAAGGTETLVDDADMLADALIIPNEKDSHWTDSARALVRGLILWLILCRDDERGGPLSLVMLPRLIAEVSAVMQANETRKAGEPAATSLFDIMAHFQFLALPEAQSVINNQGQMMLGTSHRERASILSTARTQLFFLESPQMARSLSHSSVNLSMLKEERATIYLCLPAGRIATHSRWLRLIVNLALATLERNKAKPALPVLFVLEEFAALGTMKSLERAVAYMRGFGVKLWAVLQDITQLKRDYPDSWETFLGNAGVLQAYSVNDTSTQEYLSKRMGETTIEITNKQEVNSSQSGAGDSGLRRNLQKHALMSPDEVGLTFAHVVAPDGSALGGPSLVLWSGKPPMMVHRVYYSELIEGN